MLKIFGEKKVNNNNINNNNSDSKLTIHKQNNINQLVNKSFTIFSSATKQWHNSIYYYDKNYIKTLPISDKIIYKLIKSYFNLSRYIELKKNLTLRYSRFISIRKKLSIKKIFVSKANLKHTNSKVIITVYIYNAIEKYLKGRIKRLNNTLKYRKGEYKILILKAKKQEKNLMLKIKKQIRTLTKEIPLWEKQSKTYKKDFIEKFLMTPQTSLVCKKLEIQFLIIKFLNIIYFHRSKVNYLQLAPLRYLISRIYNKEILFNIINLKYLFLNSDVFSQPVMMKLQNRKIRLLRAFKISMSVVTVAELDSITSERYLKNRSKDKDRNKNISYKTYIDPFTQKLNNFFVSGLNKKNKDIVHQILLNKFNTDNITENSILKSIDYKIPIGVRIQASGRLSRRYTASRSLSKFRYKGTLKNLASSKHNISAALLRGHVKPNLQHTQAISKTRNGSFGLKGWISSV